jgi:uncharacterized protein (UPF0276 family)
MKSEGAAKFQSSLFPSMGFGLGLRSSHFKNILGGESKVDWFEAVSENFMGIERDSDGGRPLKILQKIRANVEIVVHGVSLNIGSTDPLNFNYLNKLKNLIEIINPNFISDHLCWTGVSGENLHDLLPLPYTPDVINHVVDRILRCQDFLKQRIVFENVSSYITFNHSELSEWDFLSEVSNRADCGILLDVNNIFVSSKNHGFDPLKYLNNIPKARVAQIHLAGHSSQDHILIDTHDHPVCAEVWDLYREALKLFGSKSTMVEWDANIPDFQTLQSEVFKARQIEREVLNANSKFEVNISL